jgi:hypothetical protein
MHLDSMHTPGLINTGCAAPAAAAAAQAKPQLYQARLQLLQQRLRRNKRFQAPNAVQKSIKQQQQQVGVDAGAKGKQQHDLLAVRDTCSFCRQS